MVRGLLALSVFVSMAVAGCAGAQGGAASADGPRPTFEEPTGDEAAITGRVMDDQLAPVADAEVAIIDVQPILSATTDAAGAFVINHIPPGAHKIAVQKLGYESAARNIELTPGQALELSLSIVPIPVREIARHQTLIGEGYFACGAYLVVTSWGNLDACVWDDHKPRFEFEVAKTDLMGILQEVVWRQSTALTSEQLKVYLEYKPVCNPFCSAERQFAAQEGRSPIRNYADMEKDKKVFKEDPAPLASMTFPDGDQTPVIVFQQRMTHYITNFWGDHCVAGSEGDDCPAEVFTAIPDA